MIFLVMGVILLHTFSLCAAESSQAIEQPVTKFEWEKASEDVDTWTLGKIHQSQDNVLSVAGYAIRESNGGYSGGYLAEIISRRKFYHLDLKDPLQLSPDQINATDGRVAIVSNLFFFTACYGQGIQVNKVSYSNPPTIQIVQIINMPEARNDASWLSFNLNTLKLTGACWQFLRVWEKIKGKNEWQLKQEIVDTEQLDIPTELPDKKAIYQLNLKRKCPSIYSVRWDNDNTLKTEGFNGKNIRYWNLQTGKQKPPPVPIKEISLISTSSRVLSGLTED